MNRGVLVECELNGVTVFVFVVVVVSFVDECDVNRFKLLLFFVVVRPVCSIEEGTPDAVDARVGRLVVTGMHTACIKSSAARTAKQVKRERDMVELMLC